MQEIFNKYINYLEAERNASPYTVRNYTTDLLGFFQFLRDKEIGSLKEVDRHTLRDYLSQLMEKGFVKASIARKLSAIRSFYRYLLREEIISTSPVATTSSPKLDKRLPSFLSIEEINRLGIPVVDVGNSMLSMHSIRETAGVEDHEMMVKIMERFFLYPIGHI